MPLIVNTNLSSLIAQRNLSINTGQLNKSLEKLSSGYRINHAADDPAGLIISEQLRSQIRGQKQALQNAQDGVSILQIAEGALSVIGDNLQRIRELTVQAANDTNSNTQRDAIEREIRARLFDNDRIASATKFNGINLLTGSATNARLQIGPDASVGENTIDISSALATAFCSALGVIGTATSAGYTSINGVDFLSASMARKFLIDLDNALNQVNVRRSMIGAFQVEVESVIQNLTLSIENFSASESRIRDLDIAAETSNLTRSQILQQASVSILAQANQTSALALRLLGG